MRRILGGAVLLLVAVYTGDYVSLRYRIPKNREPLGSVQVRRYYAVMKKDGKPDFYFNPPETQTCVHALFPHFGYSPCWYLNRKKVERINM